MFLFGGKMKNKLDLLQFPKFKIFYEKSEKLWYIKIVGTKLLFNGKTKNEAINNTIITSIQILDMVKNNKNSIDSIIEK